VTYYVSLPFLRTEDGIAPGDAKEMPNEGAAFRHAESMARDPAHVGAIAFRRTGDPNTGAFENAVVLRSFGDVPANLDEL
jgi:hypothetical protein